MTTASTESVLMGDMLMEILSWLPVQSLLQFRRVCHSWKSLISHPNFIKLHLQRSPKHSDILVLFDDDDNWFVVPCSKRSLFQNPSFTVSDPHPQLLVNDNPGDPGYVFLGSCIGLVCFLGSYIDEQYYDEDGLLSENALQEYSVRFLNPATMLRSNESPRFIVPEYEYSRHWVVYGLGYDKSTDTLKVVVILSNNMATEESMRSQVKVYTMGHHCWRDIQRFPAFPMTRSHGRFLNGTLNWLAFGNYSRTFRWLKHPAELVIVSLDVGKETYKQLSLPDGLDKAPMFQPGIVILMDCLCFTHDHKWTHMVIWQMKEFGVGKSWTQFLKVSYQHLKIESILPTISVFPLCHGEMVSQISSLGFRKDFNVFVRYKACET